MNLLGLSPRPWKGAPLRANDHFLSSTRMQPMRMIWFEEKLSESHCPSTLIFWPPFRGSVASLSNGVNLATIFGLSDTLKTTSAAFTLSKVTLSISPVRKRYLLSYFLVVAFSSAAYALPSSSAVSVGAPGPETSVTTHSSNCGGRPKESEAFPFILTDCPGVAFSHGSLSAMRHQIPSGSFSTP